MNYKKFLVILAAIVVIVHLPRIIILLRLRSRHGEDTYHEGKTGEGERIMTWVKFSFDPLTWSTYITDTKKKILKFYRERLSSLLEDVTDAQLIEDIYDPHIDPFTSEAKETILHTEIFHESQVIKTNFNHRWCSGGFFLSYATLLTRGDEPVLPEFPLVPFLPEYSLLKTLIKGDHIPASTCLSTSGSSISDVARLTYQIHDASSVKGSVSTRSYILWHIMSLLSAVHPKLYNIMIPLPFKDVAGVSNNIGVVFIKWPEAGMSSEELDKMINRKKMAAVGTNLYLRGIDTSGELGKNTRNNVDIVFTSGYVRNPKIVPVASHVTFNGIADYGIYVFSITVAGLTDVSLTFSTKEFPVQRLHDVLETKGVTPVCNVQGKNENRINITQKLDSFV